MNLSYSKVLRVTIEAVNDPPVMTVNGTALGTLYEDEASWPVAVLQLQEAVPMGVGSVFTIDDADLHVPNILSGTSSM